MKRIDASRRGFIAQAAATLAAGLALDASAQAYPTKPVALVVAYTPGGSTDIVSRLLAQDLSTAMGQPVVVENRPGGGTVIGTHSVLRAAPDGHTLLFGTNAFVINSLLTKPVPWDPMHDAEPVALVTQQALGLLVRPGLKLSTVGELIAYAKANPGKLNFASSGNGSNQHLTGEAFRTAAGIDLLHVPYKGASPALQDLIGGQVDMMFTSLVGVGPYLADRRLVLLATTGRQRNAAMPDVPTVADAALPGFEAISWQGIFAPAKTPKPVIDRLQTELQKIAKAGVLTRKLAEQGMDLRMGSPEDLRQVVQRERDLYLKLMKTVSLQ